MEFLIKGQNYSVRFLAKNQHILKKLLYFVFKMNDNLSKNARIWLSKPISRIFLIFHNYFMRTFFIVKKYYSKETVEQWVMYTLYKMTVKLMYTLYNDLTNFSIFFCQICVIVVFNNVNTVRSEMWVLVFPHHSCQKLVKSLVFDSWFDKIFWHLWCGKSHTHISSSQHSLSRGG